MHCIVHLKHPSGKRMKQRRGDYVPDSLVESIEMRDPSVVCPPNALVRARWSNWLAAAEGRIETTTSTGTTSSTTAAAGGDDRNSNVGKKRKNKYIFLVIKIKKVWSFMFSINNLEWLRKREGLLLRGTVVRNPSLAERGTHVECLARILDFSDSEA